MGRWWAVKCIFFWEMQFLTPFRFCMKIISITILSELCVIVRKYLPNFLCHYGPSIKNTGRKEGGVGQSG